MVVNKVTNKLGRLGSLDIVLMGFIFQILQHINLIEAFKLKLSILRVFT